jgi:tetratricopeptide (TPR) repeat protein
MATLESLAEIVEKLSPSEIEICKSFLSAFNKRGSDNKPKIELLFNILCNKTTEPFSDQKIEQIIYRKKSPLAFEKLRARLKLKILESLTLDINLEKEEVLPRTKCILSIRKKINYGQILQNKGLYKEALIMYDSIIKEGISYEIWDEVLISLKLKRTLVALSEGKNSFKQITKQINKIKIAAIAEQKAQYYYCKLGLITNYRKWVESDSEQLRGWIIEVNEYYERARTIVCEYLLLHLEITYYQNTAQYNSAEEKLKRLIYLAKKEKVISTMPRIASAVLNLSENNILQGSFTIGLINAEEVLKFVDAKHITALRCYEIQFYSIFYQRDLLKAMTYINKALGNIETQGWDFIKGKWNYLMACCLFHLNDFENADKILSKLNPIENDKDGFNIYMKILIIMNSIERKKHDVTISRIEGLRRLVLAYKKKNGRAFREKVIYEVLNELIINHYDFAKAKERMVSKIALLEKDSLYKWKILSAELVIFEQWFKNKAEKGIFIQVISIPQPAILRAV